MNTVLLCAELVIMALFGIVVGGVFFLFIYVAWNFPLLLIPLAILAVIQYVGGTVLDMALMTFPRSLWRRVRGLPLLQNEATDATEPASFVWHISAIFWGGVIVGFFLTFRSMGLKA